MLLDVLFKKSPSPVTQAGFLNGTTPIFSQYGKNIYASDIVQMCIDCIAAEMSKLQPRHVRHDPATGKLIKPATDSINKLFKYMPNPLMTTRDFIEKVIWTLYLNSNAFIYPVYDVVTDARGNTSRNYTAFWPLNPTMVEFLEDGAGYLFIRMTFQGGRQTTLPYEDVIHLRKKFSINDAMGGGQAGTADNTALLKVLAINDTILTGTAASITLSQGVRGILKLNSTLDAELKEAERKAFLSALSSGAGVVAMDFKGDFTPINLEAKTIDSDTLAFVENKILRWFGVSLPILDGTYTDAQYAAFYNKTLEPIIVALNQAFTSVMFTKTEQSFGNTVVFYQNALELTDIQNKLAVVDSLGNRGAMSNNELRALFGMEPIDGGDEYYTSLNYINVNIADKYQLSRAGIDSQTPVTTKWGTTSK